MQLVPPEEKRRRWEDKGIEYLSEIIERILIEDEFSHGNKRIFSFRPDLSDIESIEGTILRLIEWHTSPTIINLFSYSSKNWKNLNVHLPLWIIFTFDRLEKISEMQVDDECDIIDKPNIEVGIFSNSRRFARFQWFYAFFRLNIESNNSKL